MLTVCVNVGISVGKREGNTLKRYRIKNMVSKKISKSMLYKVCRGIRNLGTQNAIQVAKLTKTDPVMWMDSDKSSRRLQYEKAIELSGLVHGND